MNDSESQKSKGESAKKNTWIAGKKTIQDWEKLKAKLDPENDDYWDKAFKFFEIRIKTRYLKPIKKIQCMNRNIGEGFAMVNLQCSLIETIESFYNGWVFEFPNFLKDGKNAKCPWEKTKDINSEKIFESFFRNREPVKGKIDGIEFYREVRCGLLHETQTKNRWIIRKKNSEENKFYDIEGQTKIIYRNNFQYALKKVIGQYKKEITTGDGLEKNELKDLRENFIAKFNRICEIS